MKRPENFEDRYEGSAGYWMCQLVDAKALLDSVNEYGGIDRLRADIRHLEREIIRDGEGIYRWRPFNPIEKKRP